MIPEGFELVRDHGDDQGVDEKIGKNSCLRRWVSFRCTNSPRRRHTPSITTV